MFVERVSTGSIKLSTGKSATHVLVGSDYYTDVLSKACRVHICYKLDPDQCQGQAVIKVDLPENGC